MPDIDPPSSRCRPAPSPAPRSSGPTSSAPSTPTSGSNASGSSMLQPARRDSSTRAPTPRTSAWRCGSSTTAPGDSPAASPAPPDAAPPARRAGRRHRQGQPGAQRAIRSSSRPSRSTPTSRGCRPTTSTRSTCRRPSASAGSRELSERLLAADGVDHVDAHADAGAGEQVLRRHRRHDDHPAAGAHPPAVHRGQRRSRRRRVLRPCAPSPRRPGAAGSTSPAPAGTSTPRSPSCPGCCRARQGAERRGGQLRPGHRPVQPVADDPRVDRARHRARPRARLRGRLRRHELRHARQARPAPVRQRRS